jgi:hypothetical protein
MKHDASTIQEYVEAAPPKRRAALELVGARTLALSPGVEATFQHGMPFYTLAAAPYIAVASQRRYLSLYIVGLEGLLADGSDFDVLVSGIDRGKNCLRFRDSQLGRLTTDLLDPLIIAAYASCAPANLAS